MTTVILHVAVAVAALLDRRPDVMKRVWFSVREVEQTVVAGIEATWDWQAELNVDDDRMRENAFLDPA